MTLTLEKLGLAVFDVTVSHGQPNGMTQRHFDSWGFKDSDDLDGASRA